MTSGAGKIGDSEAVADAAALFHPLADELMVIANRLRSAAEGVPLPAEPEQQGPARQHRPSRNAIAMARRTYALRRKRAAIFGNAEIFGEPAWDIMLDLFVAEGEGKSVSVSSACIGSAAPATTGLRWLGVLAEEGLIVRENDPEDHRRVMVRLSPTGRAAMERFFEVADETP